MNSIILRPRLPLGKCIALPSLTCDQAIDTIRRNPPKPNDPSNTVGRPI